MRISAVLAGLTLVWNAAPGTPQEPTGSSDGMAVLQSAAQHYAEAKSYLIDSIEVLTLTSDYARQWNKTVATAAEEPGGRFHFEGQGSTGLASTISDGKTVWKYHAPQHRYTVTPVAETTDTAKMKSFSMSEMGMMRAMNTRQSLARIAEQFKSADRLPDADLVVDGKTYACAVVHMGRSDLKRARSDKFDETIWIDKNSHAILKIVEKYTGKFAGVAQDQEVTTTYPRAVIDAALPDGLFSFSPPADAHQVKEFPPGMEEAVGATLVGDRVPPLKLKAMDGTVTSIESFRGKTVLIDLWATWCAPCVAALPAMAKLAKEGKDKGLLIIAVDRDEDASKAADYLKKKGIDLTNFHDGEGQTESLLGNSPLPRDVIVDPDGWVVADGQWQTPNGELDENRLRARLAGLSSSLRDLAPKPPQPAPCVASK